MCRTRHHSLYLALAAALMACGEPTQPEMSEPAVDRPQMTEVEAAVAEEPGGWRAALAEEEAARMTADEELLERLANVTTIIVEAERVVPDGTSAQIRAECPEGSRLTGGGANAFGGIGVGRLLSFGPVAGLTQVWGATMSNASGNALTLKATAICLVLP